MVYYAVWSVNVYIDCLCLSSYSKWRPLSEPKYTHTNNETIEIDNNNHIWNDESEKEKEMISQPAWGSYVGFVNDSSAQLVAIYIIRP